MSRIRDSSDETVPAKVVFKGPKHFYIIICDQKLEGERYHNEINGKKFSKLDKR